MSTANTEVWSFLPAEWLNPKVVCSFLMTREDKVYHPDHLYEHFNPRGEHSTSFLSKKPPNKLKFRASLQINLSVINFKWNLMYKHRFLSINSVNTADRLSHQFWMSTKLFLMVIQTRTSSNFIYVQLQESFMLSTAILSKTDIIIHLMIEMSFWFIIAILNVEIEICRTLQGCARPLFHEPRCRTFASESCLTCHFCRDKMVQECCLEA